MRMTDFPAVRRPILALAVIGALGVAACALPVPSTAQPATVAPGGSGPGASGASPGPAASNGAIIVDGTGADSSDPMTLTAGTYLVVWSASPPSTTACLHKAALESTNEEYLHELMNERITKPVKGQRVVIKGVPAGNYYFDVNSECAWQFVLTRQP
jgi:hypothetical protein